MASLLQHQQVLVHESFYLTTLNMKWMSVVLQTCDVVTQIVWRKEMDWKWECPHFVKIGHWKLNYWTLKDNWWKAWIPKHDFIMLHQYSSPHSWACSDTNMYMEVQHSLGSGVPKAPVYCNTSQATKSYLYNLYNRFYVPCLNTNWRIVYRSSTERVIGHWSWTLVPFLLHCHR